MLCVLSYPIVSFMELLELPTVHSAMTQCTKSAFRTPVPYIVIHALPLPPRWCHEFCTHSVRALKRGVPKFRYSHTLSLCSQRLCPISHIHTSLAWPALCHACTTALACSYSCHVPTPILAPSPALPFPSTCCALQRLLIWIPMRIRQSFCSSFYTLAETIFILSIGLQGTYGYIFNHIWYIFLINRAVELRSIS